MTADALKKALAEYGADEAGIQDRFRDNFELYELCFKEFLDGAYVPALAEAIQAKDYEKAFEAAHAIKGLSGNLGLTAYYRAVCTLVEALRAKQYAHVAEAYAETERQFARIGRAFSGETLTPDAAETGAPAAADAPVGAQKKTGKKKERFVLLAFGVAVLAIFLVLLLFQGIVCELSKEHHDGKRRPSA